jgi:hypothetical protein
MDPGSGINIPDPQHWVPDNISWRIQYKMSEPNDTMYKGQVTVNTVHMARVERERGEGRREGGKGHRG